MDHAKKEAGRQQLASANRETASRRVEDCHGNSLSSVAVEIDLVE
jgi:hypothetical protein